MKAEARRGAACRGALLLLGGLLAWGAVAPPRVAAASLAAAVDTARAARAAPAAVRLDTAAVALRTPPPGALAPYRADPALRYHRVAEVPTSWWSRLWQWLVGLLGRALGPAVVHVPGWVWYVLAAGVTAYAAVRFLRLPVRGLWAPRPPRRFAMAEAEVPSGPDLDALLAAALAQADHRRAVRLLYLRALRHLADRDLIVWRRDRTNQDYAAALRGTVLHVPFTRLTDHFEHIWYGSFTPTAASFARLRRAFDAFEEALDEAAPRRAETATEPAA